MRAISFKQPFAWAVLYAGMDVRDSETATEFRGRILVHAAAGCKKRDFGDAAAFIYGEFGITVPELEDLPRGAIVGAVNIVGCVDYSTSRWYRGSPFAFVLADAKPAPRVVDCRGQYGFFDVPAGVAAQLRAA